MQWDADPAGGFTTGDAWLPPVDPALRNVADQRATRRRSLELYRALIGLRRDARPAGSRSSRPTPPACSSTAAATSTVALNLGERASSGVDLPGEVQVATGAGAVDPGRLGPGAGVVTGGSG